MKFTLSWLRSHLDTDADATTIAEALTRIGIEVEDVTDAGAALADFRIAEVLTAERHPQANKLQVLSVDAGDGPLQVVCGAPNARAGMKGVFGPPGTYVPGSGITLKVADIRGVQSNGMMCSVRELEIGDEHDGIIELPADAPTGATYAQWAGLDDPVFDVSITPNRQDCMGVRGLARDLAAAGLGTLKPLAEVYAQHGACASTGSARTAGEDTQPPVRPEPVEGRDPGATPVPRALAGVTGGTPAPDVRTDDPAGCPAFYAQAVAGVANGAAPDWMARRLRAIGQKPISALVDITNFITVDLGRPLHVYDAAKLSGGLVARKARAGESLVALNGKHYTLDETMTVIADAAQVHDIGGIMGGEHSGVSEATTDVVVECAFFDPEHIARTGQKLNLTSDARQRFERGVDPAFLDDGLAIATALVVATCGGTPSAVTRSGTPPLAMPTIAFDPALTETLGGLAVPADRQREILERLGFSAPLSAREGAGVGAPEARTTQASQQPTPSPSLPGRRDLIQVTPPTWRRDIDGPADLVEEVIRIEGLDKVASVALPRAQGVARPTATPAQKLERRVRRAAAAHGLAEAITWSFISHTEAAAFGGGTWTVANPISEDMRVMRPSLLPGLLAAARRNLARGATAIRLFELGRRYLDDGERLTLGFVLAGDARARGWAQGKARGHDAFEAKALALALLGEAGAPVDNLQVFADAGPTWHPGRSATLRLGPKTVLAAFGAIHPATLKTFDLFGDVVAGELHLDAIPAKRDVSLMRAAYTPPALQAVRRDFAFTVPADLPAGDLVRALRGADKAAITDARLFDVFERADEKSMAVEVVLQPQDKSFTEAELKAIAEKLVAAAAKLGATLRQ